MSSSEERKEEGEAMQVDPTESEVEFAEEEAAEYRKVDSEESRAGQWDYLPEAKRPPVKGKKTFQMIFDSTKESVVKYNEDKHGEDLHDFLNRSRVANLPQELKEVETTLYCPRPSEKKGEKTADHSDDGRLLLFGELVCPLIPERTVE
uniref:Uncharacterized protein n=1 Tax=Chromera velia CCMP2878 TaxID=1169474 RepID=A0A0G4I0V2_9ALVE|eukprot:Cvel_34543.t1-p1 / transcript=Cvel_34543.t1 / gene=Cvel_34543 / organism=Chromera_velia_CCMP2878 / gene_product=hypothetical protein / transcript_product=hypothetical protein / location=Cvel_scaffold5971:1064-2013(+) / protein_length=148 / sequence_SO=supercontig / SO=protein_coding / is_pseudo=false